MSLAPARRRWVREVLDGEHVHKIGHRVEHEVRDAEVAVEAIAEDQVVLVVGADRVVDGPVVLAGHGRETRVVAGFETREEPAGRLREPRRDIGEEIDRFGLCPRRSRGGAAIYLTQGEVDCCTPTNAPTRPREIVRVSPPSPESISRRSPVVCLPSDVRAVWAAPFMRTPSAPRAARSRKPREPGAGP